MAKTKNHQLSPSVNIYVSTSSRGRNPGDVEAISEREIASPALGITVCNDGGLVWLPILVAGFLLVAGSFCPSPDAQSQEAPASASVETVSQDSFQMARDSLHLDFRGATLMNVLRVLSGLTEMNFVAGTEVAEREVNLLLDNVSLQNALDAIAQGSNVTYDFIPGQNIYLFRASSDRQDVAQLNTRIFKLYYIRASELRQIEGGEKSNASSFANLEEDSGTVQTDTPILRIVESILSERGRVKVDNRSNSLVVTDAEDKLRLIELTIAELDRPLNQVLIQAIIIETFGDLDRQLGLDWSNTSDGEFFTLTGGAQATRFPFNINESQSFFNTSLDLEPTPDTIFDTTNFPTGSGTKDFTALAVKLKALQTATKLKILAKPRILVVDNHPALIKITTNAAIGLNSVTTATNDLQAAATNSAERTETGTSLRVTPLINSEGRITLSLEPRFVTISTSGLDVTTGANVTGDATIRTTRTTLIVNDGQTIVLGGLLSSQQSVTHRKVPFLGDLPLIGEIFRSRTTTIDDREMILFINTRIIRDPSEVQAVAIDDERLLFDDENAPFWKYKRKQWYRNWQKGRERHASSKQEQAYERERGQRMESVLSELALRPTPRA